MKDNSYRLHLFAQILCEALGNYAYVIVGKFLAGRKYQVLSYGDWAGIPKETPSRAPHIAYAKFGELVLQHGLFGEQLIMTPIIGNEKSFGYMGGVSEKGVIVAVSKWAEEHDRLLALLTLYNAVHDSLVLHHVGIRFSTRSSYEASLWRYNNVMKRPADDHERAYFNMGTWYQEHQYFPVGNSSDARHFDFVVSNPKHLLQYIASAFNTVPTFWETGKNDPIGVVWIQAKSDGSMLGVMARDKWWQVEDS